MDIVCNVILVRILTGVQNIVYNGTVVRAVEKVSNVPYSFHEETIRIQIYITSFHFRYVRIRVVLGNETRFSSQHAALESVHEHDPRT